MADTLTEGQKLVKGESITSKNGAYKLILQDDGNLVLYARDHAVWSTGTNGQNVVRAEVQTDGNFVLYTPDKPVWASQTKGKKDVKLVMQDDRNLVLYAKGDDAVWSSKTDTKEPPPPAAAEPKSGKPKPGTGWYSRPKDEKYNTGVAAEPAAAAPEATHMTAEAPAAEAPAAEAPAPPPPPPPPPPPQPRTYTVVSGDTLWAISERFYGDGSQYMRIANASGISNPDLIYPGQVLTIP